MSGSYIARTDGMDITVTPVDISTTGFPNGIDLDSQGNVWIPTSSGLKVYVGDY